MAEKRAEDFLTCAVCYDVLKDPRNLSCGHTFCRSCLSQFTVISAAVAGSVPCPYCRQMTKVPDNSVSREKWAGQLERSVLLTELEDMAAIVRRDTGTDDGDESDITETNLRGENNQQLTCYCLDCKSIVFNECCSSSHSNCEVVPPREALPSVVENLKSTRAKLTTVAENTHAHADELKRIGQEIKKSEQEVCEEIESTCEKAVKALLEKKEKMIEQLAQMAQAQTKKIQLGIRLTERSASVQQLQADLVDKMLNDGSDVGKLEMQVTSSKLFFDDEGPGKHNKFKRFWVKHDLSSIYGVLQGPEIESTSSGYQQSLCSLLPGATYSIKREDEDEIPFLVDVVAISLQGMYSVIVVVTDNSNCCARSFYNEGTSNVVESKVKFRSPPWGIGKLVSNQILVALPESMEIARLRVTPKLETITKFSTMKSYRSIAVLDHMTIVAGVSSPEHACVDILDLSGKIQRSFSSEFPVKNPGYLSFFRQDSFLVSDYALGSVTCVNVDGEVQFTYRRGVRGPSGISVDKRGNIFIVDRETGILVVYETWNAINRPYLKPLLDKTLQTPWGVCVDRFDHVYVLQGGSIREIQLRRDDLYCDL